MKNNKQYGAVLVHRINRIGMAFLSLVLLFTINYAQTGGSQSMPQPPQVEIAGSQLLKIHSTITGQEYVLHINLPQHYNDTSKTFPVIYLIDSQWDFPLVTAIYGDEFYDGCMPGAIIVGITWGGQKPDYDARRAFDLTPTSNGQAARYGNAEKFLSFIKSEAIPFIDGKYRTNKNDRTLMGHSFGGLFTVYALLTEPELFHRYVSGSPAWAWDRSSINKYTDTFSKMNLSHPLKVYMCVGEYEDVNGFEKLAETLKGCKINGMELETKIIQGAGHSGVKPEGYTRGLQNVFTRKSIKVSSAVLDSYVGTYEINPMVKTKVMKENDQLVAVMPGNPKITPYAETEEDFYIKGAFLFIHFKKDAAGKVSGFTLQQYGGEAFVKKVE